MHSRPVSGHGTVQRELRVEARTSSSQFMGLGVQGLGLRVRGVSPDDSAGP